MAANFWTSTHARHCLYPKERVEQSNGNDRATLNSKELKEVRVYFIQTIRELCKKSNLRARVFATAAVYFKRFYLEQSFVQHDPVLIAPTCVYLAAKVEECTTQVKKISTKISQIEKLYGYSPEALLDAEYTVLQHLGFQLIVFHAYKEIPALLKSCGIWPNDKEACDSVWQAANDSYITDVSLMYPPHVIALACVFFGACILCGRDLRNWFASLTTVDLSDVWIVVSELMDAFELWSVHDFERVAITNLSRLKISRPVPPAVPQMQQQQQQQHQGIIQQSQQMLQQSQQQILSQQIQMHSQQQQQMQSINQM